MRTAVLCILLVVGCGQGRGQGQYAAPRGQVVFPDGTHVSVEVADTDEKRARGLMFRDHLPRNAGMLFVFETPGFYPFWMQNCLIALDLIWLDPSARIVSIAESVPPCRFADCPPPCASVQCPTYPPAAGTSALYVVEVTAGFAKQHKVKVGDQLIFKGVKGAGALGAPGAKGASGAKGAKGARGNPGDKPSPRPPHL